MGTPGTVASDERLLDVVEELKRRTTAGVTEVASALEMPKSTVHTHLSTLQERGYVVQNDAGKYRLSLRFLDIGSTVKETRERYDEVVAKLRELAEETDEKAWWTVEENGKAVFVAKAVGRRGIQTNARIGQHVELYQLAAGKAILAAQSEDRRERLLDGYDYPLPDGTSREALTAELGRIQDRGVAYGDEDFLDGVTGVGAPLRDNSGTIYGAISISGPANRLGDEAAKRELSDLVRGVSGELRVNLSYR
jgi:DNA-binding IclR family transcriptional regulator